jgi:hypothetical protein
MLTISENNKKLNTNCRRSGETADRATEEVIIIDPNARIHIFLEFSLHIRLQVLLLPL